MSYNADTESNYIENGEPEFYQGFVSPADEWQVTKSSLFREFTGSIFKPNDKMPFRLAKLNEIVAFSESPDTKKVNKKNYIDDRFNFLREFVPEQKYIQIIEVMAFLKPDKKKIAKDISLNIETLASILSLWQLELHASGNYITERTLDEINVFLKESSTYSDFRCKGHITSKDIERAEGRILRQLYEQAYAVKDEQHSAKKLPQQVLIYYQDFMMNLEQHLNENQRKLQEKKSILPFHVYQLVQKIDVMKKIIYKVSIDYFKRYISQEEFSHLSYIIDEFYKEKNALAGEIVAQLIILLEQYYQTEAILEDLPKKFMTRVRKYRIDLSEEFKLIIERIKESIEVSDNFINEDMIEDTEDKIVEIIEPNLIIINPIIECTIDFDQPQYFSKVNSAKEVNLSISREFLKSYSNIMLVYSEIIKYKNKKILSFFMALILFSISYNQLATYKNQFDAVKYKNCHLRGITLLNNENTVLQKLIRNNSVKGSIISLDFSNNCSLMSLNNYLENF